METYWQRDLVINNREVRYDGIFNFDEVMRTLKSALREKGYEWKEKRTEETVMEEGRKSFLEARPFKVKTDYITLMMKIKINLINTGEIVQELPGRKRRMQQGEISLVFDAWFLSDYEHRWGMKPVVMFIKGLINKFLYPLPREEGIRGELVADTTYVAGQIRKLFHSYGPEKTLQMSEEEIRKKVDEEIRRKSRSQK